MKNKLILGAICGDIAEAYYGYLNNDLQEVVVNKLNDIKIIGYESYPTIKLPLSVGL